MKYTNSLKRALSAALLSLLLLLMTPIQVIAASVQVSLSSSASSVQNGQSFVVTVNLVTTGSVTDAQVRILFDTTKLNYVSADFTGSPLTDDFGSTVGSGMYTIDRYKLGSPFPSGTILLGRLTFTAKAGSGTASVTVSTADSTVGNSAGGTHTPITVSPATVTLTTPSSPTPPPAAPTPPPAAPSNTTTKTTPSPSPSSPTNNTTKTPTPAAPDSNPSNPSAAPTPTAPPTATPAPVVSPTVPVVEVNTPSQNNGKFKTFGKIAMATAGLVGAAALVLVALRMMHAQKRKQLLYHAPASAATKAGTEMPHETKKALDSIPVNLPAPSAMVHPTQEASDAAKELVVPSVTVGEAPEVAGVKAGQTFMPQTPAPSVEPAPAPAPAPEPASGSNAPVEPPSQTPPAGTAA